MSAFFLGLLAVLLALSSMFMILLILVQKGRGGGITGALGGAGGQSAFGSKAGDMFTRITVGTAVVWIFLAMITISVFNAPEKTVSLEPADSSLSGTGTDETNQGDGAKQPGVTDQQGDPLPGEGVGGTGTEGAQPGDPGLNAPTKENGSAPESAPGAAPGAASGAASGTEQPKSDAPATGSGNSTPPGGENTPPAEAPKKEDSAGGGQE